MTEWLFDRSHCYYYSSRWGFDFVSRYKHKPMPIDKKLTVSYNSKREKNPLTKVYIQIQELREGGYILDERQWLNVRMITLSTFLNLM